MYCKHCGKELEEDARFCSGCGEVVQREEDQVEVNLSKQEEQQESHRVEDTDDLTNEEKVLLFIGQNQYNFLRKWNQESSWNWAGFFLSYYWLGYRKLYMTFFILLGIMVGISLLTYLVLPVELHFLSSIFAIGINIYIGLKGNTLYRNYLNKKLAEIDLISKTKQEKTQRILAAGGTSIGGIFAVFGFSILWVIVYAFIVLKPIDFLPEAEVVFGTGTYEFGIEEEKESFDPNDVIIMEAYFYGPIDVDEVEFVIYRNYAFETSWTSSVDPTWDSFIVEIAEENSDLYWGDYTVKIFNMDSEVLAEGKFTIN